VLKRNVVEKKVGRQRDESASLKGSVRGSGEKRGVKNVSKAVWRRTKKNSKKQPGFGGKLSRG